MAAQSLIGPSVLRFAAVTGALALVLAACGGEPVEQAETAQQQAPAVTVADIEADLTPLLAERYGEAMLRCGMTDMFAGGMVQSVLQDGNAFPCLYMSEPESRDVVWVDMLVLMTGDDTYGVHVTREAVATEEQLTAMMEAQGEEFGGLLEPTSDPEWLYRDGLTCADLVRPVTDETAPGPDFVGYVGMPQIVDGLSYPEVLYYFYDNDRPAGMDPDGDGRPCTEFFPDAEIVAFDDSVRQVSGTATAWQPTSPMVTTFDIRTAMAADGLPPNATQVDCSLAGPVSVGSLFTCAPRLNEMPELPFVVVVEPDGSYLSVGPGEGDRVPVSPELYRQGLSCDDLSAPLTVDTVGDGLTVPLQEAQEMAPELSQEGLDYLGAVMYFHLNGQPSKLDTDGNGWPCEQEYADQEIDEARQMVKAARDRHVTRR